jgi:tetratricopeptide (TPR) repeat protein
MLADLRRAEQDFRTGIACDARNEYTRASLCHTLLQQWANSPNHDAQLLVEAREHCDKALEINPQFVVAAINIGYILYRQGKHQDALQYFDNLSQRYPTNSALFLNYGFLLYLQYLADSGETMLKQAADQTLESWKLNQNSVAANNLGYFYYEQGDYVRAVDFWEKANAMSSGDPDTIAGLALGAYKLGDETTTITLLARAIQIDSHYNDPNYLKRNRNWSTRAASDLSLLLQLLPNSGPN